MLELPPALRASVVAHLRDGRTGLAQIAIFDHFWPSPGAQSVMDVIGVLAAEARVVLVCEVCGATPAQARSDYDLGALCAACATTRGPCTSWPCASCSITMHGSPSDAGSVCPACRGRERWEALPASLRAEVDGLPHIQAIKAVADFIGGDRRLPDAQEILHGREWGPVQGLLASLGSARRAVLEEQLRLGKTNLVISTLRQFRPEPEPRVVVEAVVALADGISLVCPMCGEGVASARDDHEFLPLCDGCSARYETSPCPECGDHVQVARGSGGPCSPCASKLMWAGLTASVRDEVDAAVAELSAAPAISRIRELTGCGLSEAVRLHDLRRQEVRG